MTEACPGAGRYVSMGSSFAAGPGLRPRAADSPRGAGRAQINYAHLIAEELALPLIDVSYSGATVVELENGGPRARPAQVLAVERETELVTITGGGNDIGYLPALTLASLPAGMRMVLAGRNQLVGLLDRKRTAEKLSRLEEDLHSLVSAIQHRAPRARVVLVGYLTILPPAGASTGVLPTQVAEWGRWSAAGLGAVMAAAAVATGATFVDVGTASLDHHAWSTSAWTRRFHYSLRGGAPYHPNAAGMRAVASLVSAHLRK